MSTFSIAVPPRKASRLFRPRPPRPRPPAEAKRPEPPFDRAWGVVLGAFLVTMVGYGAIYSYAAFADDIAAGFGASRAAISFVYALSGGACFLVSALTGALADRIGTRVLAAVGMLLVGLGFLVAAAANTLLEVYLGYGLLVGLGTGCAYVPAMALVQAWFRVHRGLASGLAVSGIGVGTALVPPTVGALAALGDWRIGFLACAGLCVAIGLAGAALLRPAPWPLDAARDALPPPSPPPTGRRLRSRGFVLSYLGTFLVSMPAVLPHALLVSSALDLGMARGEALALLGLIGVGTIAGRLVLAVIADQLGRSRVFLLCCAGMSASMLVWGFGREGWTLLAFALGFGALQGGFVALLPAFMADRFGATGLGGLLGALYTGRGFALLVAPPLLAFAATALVPQGTALAAVALLGLVGTWLLAAARHRP